MSLDGESCAAPALQRGLEVLERLAQAEQPVSFAALQETCTFPRASLVRLLAVLRTGGWVSRTTDGYALGDRVARLQAGQLRPGLGERAQAFLDQLMQATDCSAICFSWQANVMTAVAKTVHPAAPSMQDIGQRTTATELMLGPWWWIADWKNLAVLKHRPPRSGTARALWISHGVAYDDAQVLPFIRRMATAITVSADQRVVGFIGLGGNALLMPDGELTTKAGHLRAAARAVSEAISHGGIAANVPTTVGPSRRRRSNP